ncbi:MAG: endonuclease/exonuclease/phosphatase family protein [Limisphaerales bacterium]
MRWILGILLVFYGQLVRAQDSFTVATYNVKNYLVETIPGRKAKPAAERQRVQQVILQARPDVLALQEMGQEAALQDLLLGLREGGWNYPHYQLMNANDRAIRLALLSRFPITRMVTHTNDQFLADNSRQWVRRGFLEAEIRVAGGYRFTLLAAHLKSKFQVPYARESEIRKREAAALRRKVEAILDRDPKANLVVLGDLNDTPDSTAVRTIMGRGKQRLFDPKPFEWAFADDQFVMERPRVQWTYYFPSGGVYSRVDYVLMSSGMKREWQREATGIPALPYWFEASDHRLVKVGFRAEDR